MQSGNLLSSDVMAYTSRVVVSGIQRAVSSWSVGRELSGDLPQTVASGSGITQATGSISWASEKDVADTGLNPWNKSTGWLPAKGEPVQIYVSDGATEWMVFTGVIDNTTGGEGKSQSRIIDRIDDLARTLTLPALLSSMPPAAAGGDYRPCGLSSSFYVDWAMRAGGFFATPRQEAGAVLHVPMQTSMWPHSGTLTRVSKYAGGTNAPLNAPAPWGWCMNDFQGFYTPASGALPSTNLQVTTCVAPNHAGAFLLTAYYGASNRVELGVNSAKSAFVTLDGTTVATLPMGAGTIVTALFLGNTVEIRNNAGGSITATLARSGTTLNSIRILGDGGARIAGVQVSVPTTVAQRFASLTHTPTGVMDMSSPENNGIMDAGRALQDVKAIDLLTEISDATLSGMWIDETGVLRFVPTLALRARASARTVTTLDDITGLEWEDSYLGAASRVKVTARVPAISKAKQATIAVWEGSRDTMESAEEREIYVEPSGDEDWVQPDFGLQVLSDANWGAFNLRRGSFAGAYFTNADTPATGYAITASLSQVGIDKAKITHLAPTLPANVVANLSTPPSVVMWQGNQSAPLPRIGAYGLITWAEITIAPVTVAGIGPELVHDAKEWNSQRTSTAGLERMAQYLAGWLANPKPVITSLGITPDPRLQLGDVITIDSPNLMGISIKTLIVGINTSAGSQYEQSLSVRILEATSLFTTYREHNDSIPESTLTYAQWQALGPNLQTYSDLNISG